MIKDKTAKYEVQHYTLFNGWINCWTDENEKLSYFNSKEETQEEIKNSVDEWNCDPNTEHDYNYNEYRVVKIN